MKLKVEFKNFPLYNPDVLDQFVEETGEYFTDNLSDAMYLFPDGRMTCSTYFGSRVDDHNVLEDYFDLINRQDVIDLKYKNSQSIADYNNVVTQALGAVMIVPESREILKGSQQELTDSQVEAIAKGGRGFSVDDYVQNHPLDLENLA